jgi:hypothetical protein
MQAIAIASAGGLGRPGLELRLEENLMGGSSVATTGFEPATSSVSIDI